jgi:hypothetical protein
MLQQCEAAFSFLEVMIYNEYAKFAEKLLLKINWSTKLKKRLGSPRIRIWARKDFSPLSFPARILQRPNFKKFEHHKIWIENEKGD